MAKTPSSSTGFSRKTVGFLIELTENNDRDWFKANQPRYEEQVREPARAFIRAMAPKLARSAKHMLASDKKVGGSMMRPQRDTRFGSDKTPYKTNVGIHFRHEAGKDVHAPGLYVHIDPAEVFLGVGIWHPDTATLGRLRAYIAEHPAAWRKARDNQGFRGHFDLAGDSLKRPPKGFDADHPLIEDLKRKDHLAVCSLTPKDVVRPDFAELAAGRFRSAKPYMKFLCAALDLPY